MITCKDYTLDFEQALSMPYKDVIAAIYDAIPSHDVEDLSRADITYLLGYYPVLFSRLSRQFSLAIEATKPRVYNNVYYMKQALEQALKVVKFQYDALSRKITVDKDETKTWLGEQK